MLSEKDLNNFVPIVLCAGFGNRLKPLTNYIPKVVCPIINKPAAFLNIEIFLKAGFDKVHCNTHYLNNDVHNELVQAANYYGYDSSRIVFWNEDEILETGGGITRIYNEISKNDKNFDKDVIAVSGDIVADFPLEDMITKWKNREKNDYALMCTKHLTELRKDVTWTSKDDEYILGFGEEFKDKNNSKSKIFTNHQIISHEIIKESSIERKSSIDIFYRKALNLGKNIINLPFNDNSYWFDIGTPKNYLLCINFFKNKIYQNLDSNYFYHNNIINYCFTTTENFKIILNSLTHKNVSSIKDQEQVIISFRDLNKDINNLKLIPLNILNTNNKVFASSIINEFSILI